MDVSVIVPVHNSARYLHQCIQALLDQDYSRENYEVFMVDNGSTDGSLDIIRQYPEVRLIREPKRGSYAARNRALRLARGRIAAFTDSDCAPSRSWLSTAVQSLSDPSTQVVLGVRQPGSKGYLLSGLIDYEIAKDEYVYESRDKLLYYGFTNNMAARRETLERYGLFEERSRGADTIMIRRIVEKESCKAITYNPGMTVRHMEMDGVLTYYRKTFTYGRSRQLYQPSMLTRPLTLRERMIAFRRAARRGRYSAARFALLSLTLAGGMFAWTLGSWSALATGRRT